MDVQLRLFGTHVLNGTDDLTEFGKQGFVGQLQLMLLGFGESEVDHFGDWLAVLSADQHVAGFEVAMNDSFLVSMMHGLANRNEQFQAVAHR